MRTEQLEYLLHIAKTNSINKASEQLHISHQSLTTSIKNLETELGVTIFTRTTKGVFLTEEGRKIVTLAENILNDYNNMKNLSHFSALEGNLSVTAAPFVGLSFLSMVTNTFIFNYPQISLTSKAKETIDILSSMNTTSSDLLFAASFFPEKFLSQINHHRFTVLEILKTTAVAVSSTTHEIAKYKTISLSTVFKYPYALFQANENSHNGIFDIVPENIKINVKFITDHVDTFCKVLESGKFISIISECAIKTNSAFKDNPFLTYHKIKDAPITHLYAIINKDSYRFKKPLIDAYLATIDQYLN